MANDIVKEATAKESMISRGSNYSSKQARMDKDEKELEELMKAQYGSEEEVEEVQEEETEEPIVEAKEVEEVEDESDEKLSREEKSFKKRYGDLRRHMAEKEKEWKDKLESVESEAPLRAPKSDEDIEAWAEKYPDVAAIVETIASKKADEKFDFDELRDSDSFHDWVDEQPKWVRDALYENSDDAASVIRVIDLYKVDNGMTPSAKKSKAKDAAKTVTKRSRTTVDDTGLESLLKESTVSKMTDKEFEDRYDEIQEAMQSGKFVYDISGKAR